MSVEAVLIASVVVSGLAVVLCILIIYLSRRAPSAISPALEQRLLSIEGAIVRSDTTIRDEFGRGRDEGRESSRSLREEVAGLFESLGDALRACLGEKLDMVTGQITALTEGNERRQETLRANVEAKLGELKTDAGVSAKALREEITTNLQNLAGALSQTIEQISQSQKERLDRVSGSVAELTERSGAQHEALRKTVEERLDAIRNENTELRPKARAEICRITRH
jgi:DNA recombination protein RmuC